MAEQRELKPVYLITGSDEPKVELAVSRLRGRFAPEAVERVSALDTAGDDVVALCNAGSLFGDARLVLVESVDGRRTTEGRLTGGWKAADVGAVTAYLQLPAPATTLKCVPIAARSASRPTWATSRSSEPFSISRTARTWVATNTKEMHNHE